MRGTRRLGTALASGAAVCGLAVAPAWGNSPAVHFVEDVAGDVIECDTTTYTITSGTIKLTFHEGSSRSGNLNFTGTITPQKVTAVDEEGNVYRVSGAFWFGATINAQRESGQETFTGKLQIVARGGTADSLNVTFHANFVGDEITNVKDFDFGSCAEPE
jgi:hypothetical protein